MATQTTQTQTILPQWYTDYATNLLTKAQPPLRSRISGMTLPASRRSSRSSSRRLTCISRAWAHTSPT
jgi:hypothetical protein